MTQAELWQLLRAREGARGPTPDRPRRPAVLETRAPALPA